MNRWAALTVCALCLSGCVTQDMQLKRPALATSATSPRGMGRTTCQLAAFEFVDARREQRLGAIGPHELTLPDLDHWIDDSLRQATAGDSQSPTLLVELNRAYLQNHPSGHSFQVVLRVRSLNADDSEWRVYRGLSAGITWWGSSSEFSSYVQAAARVAIRKLVVAEGRCAT